MLRAGDELGHSQQGNNNAYCQDNPISWINWQEADKNLMAFTTQLIALRQQIPALISGEWWHSLAPNKTVEWLNAQGMPVTLEQWQHSYPLQVLLSGQWLLLINFTEQPHEMTLPQGDWQIVAPFHHHSLSPIPPKPSWLCNATDFCQALIKEVICLRIRHFIPTQTLYRVNG